jgi:hypothetical protein
VECIAHGKARARYEFGVKTSFAVTNARGAGGQFVLDARTLPGNPYDRRGHRLHGRARRRQRADGRRGAAGRACAEAAGPASEGSAHRAGHGRSPQEPRQHQAGPDDRHATRPDGATIAQIVEATGWQPHTVRGAFAGALKKKLGLEVTSEKVEGGERVYRIV